MSSTAAGSRTVRVADFEVDLQSAELRKGDLTTRLPEQPFRILLLLLEKPGEVVTREELRSRLWSAETFVDFDTGLNSAMRKLREALGDSADTPKFIETLPRRGYRFIAPVHESSSGSSAAAPSFPRYRKIAVAVAAGVLLAAGVAVVRLGPASAQKIESLAVLPLTNLTADRDQDYFADAMTDALTSELSQLRDVRVISRTSAMQYRERTKSLPQIAKELRVDALIEGTVVRAGSRVRITAELIQLPAERRLWSGSYERDFGDILMLQHELAEAVAGAVRAKLAAGGDIRPARHIDPRAYDSFLRSHIGAGKGTVSGLKEAIAYAQDATARQPDFAAAWSAMGRYYLQGLFLPLLTPQECLQRADVAARRALELDPLLAEAHTLRGSILARQWKWAEAEKEYRRAIELAPSDAAARRAYSAYLTNDGRPVEALREAQRALDLDPLFLQARLDYGTALRGIGRYDDSIAAYRKVLDADPGIPRAHYQLGRTYLAAGDVGNATAAFERAVELSGRNPRYLYPLAYAYGRAGRVEDARKVLDELTREGQYVSLVGLALVYTGLGDRESALAALEKAYDEQAIELAELRGFSEFESLYAERRFRDLISRMGQADRGEKKLSE